MTMHFPPARPDEIEDEVARIVAGMPMQRGVDGEQLVRGYVDALSDQPIRLIEEAITGFLRGRFAADFSMKWCPTAPELAIMVRTCREAAAKPASTGAAHSVKPPRSTILKRDIGRDFARRLVDEGIAPRGSIFVAYHGANGVGVLFGPDPEWVGAVPIKEPMDEEPNEDRLSDADHARLSAWRDRMTRMGVM